MSSKQQRRFRLLVNVGVPEARRLGLPGNREGDVIPVADERVASELLRRHLAVEDAREAAPSAAPRDLKAVPPVDLKSAEGGAKAEGAGGAEGAGDPDAPPDFDELTKEELKAYADAHKFQGVSMSQTKDEMVAQVKREARRAAR